MAENPGAFLPDENSIVDRIFRNPHIKAVTIEYYDTENKLRFSRDGEE